MPQFIVYHEGKYNIHSTVSDGPYFSSGLTLDQLTHYIKEEFGNRGLTDLPARLKRAHATGCSGLPKMTLEECLSCNRAGPRERHLSTKEYIDKFLK